VKKGINLIRRLNRVPFCRYAPKREMADVAFVALVAFVAGVALVAHVALVACVSPQDLQMAGMGKENHGH
jgi:hypothetical protein